MPIALTTLPVDSGAAFLATAAIAGQDRQLSLLVLSPNSAANQWCSRADRQRLA
jgi:hypothetical protein